MSRYSGVLSVISLLVAVCSVTGFSLPNEDPLLKNYEALEAKLLKHVEALQQANNALEARLKAEVAFLRTGQPVSLATDRQCCTINRMPTSCEELGKIGHQLAGFYTVKAAGGLQSIYCDFTKAVTQPGFQTTIGLSDVKSSSVYFFAQRDTQSNLNDQIITYSSAPMNIGDALNIKTGVFTAPTPGKYFISFTGTGRTTADNGKIWVRMLLNGGPFAEGFCEQPTNGKECPPKVHATVNLKKGETISIKLGLLSMILHDDAAHYTQFTGWHIEEDISSLLA